MVLNYNEVTKNKSSQVFKMFKVQSPPGNSSEVDLSERQTKYSRTNSYKLFGPSLDSLQSSKNMKNNKREKIYKKTLTLGMVGKKRKSLNKLIK